MVAPDPARRIPIMTVFGTRPEAVKMAPVVEALRRSEDFVPQVVVTAQHREMLDQVLHLFAITPDRDLDIMLPEQSLVDIVTRALAGLSDVMDELRPAMVLVQGDAHTTFVGALAAYYRQIPIGHVEAGLRTYDKYQPFPEELNRRMTTELADLHFPPTATAKANLLREGVDDTTIVVTGNTVIDALLTARRAAVPAVEGIPNLDGRRLLLVETHRRENWGQPLLEIFQALLDIVREFPDTELVLSMHRNPAVRRAVDEALRGQSRVHLIEPPDYGPWIRLMEQAYLLLTDSGGLQEEAPALGTPVLVLRRTTERPEGIAAGTVRLVGVDRPQIVAETARLLTDRAAYEAMATAKNPYGDGRAAERIVDSMRWYFKRSSSRPEGIAAGTVRLVGVDRPRIVAETRRLLTDRAAYEAMATAKNPYGDGRAAERIVESLRWYFQRSSSRPEEFAG